MKRKRWWIALVVSAVVVIGEWMVGPELWAWSWEKRWVEFRAEWEARGEDFGVEAHWHAPVPDEDNVAMHPFMQQLTADALAIMAMPNVRTTSIRLEQNEVRRLEVLERLRE